MRPVVKSVRNNAAGNPLTFAHWSDAKPDLINELGSFCSFCEKYNSRSALHVEHIHGKGCINAAGNLIYDHLQFRWDNFLLGCVNCNSIKGDKDINALNPYMPHQNNLIHFIEVIAGGLVQIKPMVAGADLTNTQAYIDLVGLNRVPGHPNYSNKDDRWDNRLKVADIAQRQFNKYTDAVPSTDVETIVELARANGYFSIWYYQFLGRDEVIDALLNGINVGGVLLRPFPGSHTGSFDNANHHNSVVRP